MALDVNLNLVETLDDALALKRWLSERRPVLGADTETGGLRYWEHRLRTVQVGDAQTGWVIPTETWLGFTREIFAAYDRPIVYHNASFDSHFLERYKIPVKRHLIDDTMIMHHIFDPPARHGLKPLSTALIDPMADYGQQALREGFDKQGWDWDTVPIDWEPFWVYSALDPILTARLWELSQREGWVSGRKRPVYETEMANVWAHVDAERRGMRIDVDYAHTLKHHLLDRADQLREQGKREYGVSLGSGEQVTARLVADGVPLWKQTDKGRWSLDKEVLEELSGAHPLADMVISYKQSVKFATAYVDGVLDRLEGDRVHAEINTVGARTGRMSVSKPALQQIPSKDWRVRRMFIPADDNVLLSADLSGIEVRLLAHYARVPAMIHAFETGQDVHSMMARIMYPRETQGMTDDQLKHSKYRKGSKSGTLGKQYGIGIRKFALQQGVSEAEAQRFMATYDDTFPEVKDFLDYIEVVAKQRRDEEHLAYVDDPSGRRYTLTPQEAREGKFYTLGNHVNQGWAAQLLKQAVAALHQSDLGQYYIMPVHDETLLDLPKELVEEAIPEMKEIMQTGQAAVSVPLATDVEVYPHSWSESVEGYEWGVTDAQ